MKSISDFYDEAAMYCEEHYDSEVHMDRDGMIDYFECPFCHEKLYFDDYDEKDTDYWHKCPKCYIAFGYED